MQLEAVTAGLCVHPEHGLAIADLFGLEGEFHLAALAGLQQDGVGFQFELGAATILQFEARRVRAAASVEQQQLLTGGTTDSNAAKSDRSAVENLDPGRRHLTATGEGQFDLWPRRIVGAQHDAGTGWALVAGLEEDVHIVPGAGLDDDDGVTRPREGFGVDTDVDFKIGAAPVQQGHRTALWFADFRGFEIDADLGQGRDRQLRRQTLAGDGDVDDARQQVARVHRQAAADGAVPYGREIDGQVEGAVWWKAPSRTSHEGKADAGGYDGETVDGELDAPRVHQLHGSFYRGAHGRCTGIDPCPRPDLDRRAGDDSAQRDGERLGPKELLDLQLQIARVGAAVGRGETNGDAPLGAGSQAQRVGVDGEGATLQLHADVDAARARIAHDDLATHGDARLEHTKVDDVRRYLERLSGGDARRKEGECAENGEDGGAERAAQPSKAGCHRMWLRLWRLKRKSDQLTRMPKKHCRSSTFIMNSEKTSSRADCSASSGHSLCPAR